MALDKADIEKISQLARLQVTEAEAAEVAQRITSILDLIDQMQAVDTDQTEPMAHPLDMVQRLRPDRVTEQDRRDELQKLAPAIEDGLFLVPRVIE